MARYTVDFISHCRPSMTFVLDAPSIDLESLAMYFRDVESLKYSLNGQSHTVRPIDGEFVLPPNISVFEVVQPRVTVGESELTKIVRDLFQGRYTYKEISALLHKKYGIDISIRTLQRVYRFLNLKRKKVKESDIGVIIEAILVEMAGPGISIGYKSMWQRLRQKHELNVKQITVLKLMRIIDPDGIEERSRHRLIRRVYSVPGPNFLWHVDGFDKLKHFGFAISGCVDGFSRRVIWMAVATTNNKTEVIAWHFLNAIKDHGCLPCIVRSDRGTENVKIALIQIALRSDDDDENANTRSFLKGKSTANERIEKYWRQLINHTVGFYIKLFKNMESKREYNRSIPFHVETLRYCFGPLLESHIEQSTSEWNQHRIRQQKNLSIPCGIPDVMYYCPEKYDARDCGKDVHIPGIDALVAQETIEPRLYDDDIENFIKLLLPNSTVPTTIDEAYDLFRTVTQMVDSLDEFA